MSLFEIDDSGWIQQNRGREPWELVREALQNALDTESNIYVEVNTRKRQVIVKDEGEGFNDLSDAYTIFGGDKGSDPTMRGRFGRGLKELVAGAESVKVFSTGGSVEFDVAERERIDLGRSISSGTKVVAENSEWSKEEFDELKEYLFKIWAPEDQKVVYNLQGGSNGKHERWDPEKVVTMYLQTVKYEDQMKKTPKRTGEVHIKRAEDGNGRIYEMGIPVKLDCNFPFWVDVQQKIPMAEQRNEPNSRWLEKFEAKILNETYEMLSELEMRNEWVTRNLGSYAVDYEVKEKFVEEVIEDRDKEGVVVRSDGASDDKARNYGYQVVDPGQYCTGAAKAMKDVLKTSRVLAEELHENNESKVDPTAEQERFMRFARGVAEDLGYDEVSFETWLIEPSYEGKCPVADHQRSGLIRLNTFANDWEEVTTQTLGAVVHEISHEVGKGHSEEWYSEMEENFAELLVNNCDLTLE